MSKNSTLNPDRSFAPRFAVDVSLSSPKRKEGINVDDVSGIPSEPLAGQVDVRRV